MAVVDRGDPHPGLEHLSTDASLRPPRQCYIIQRELVRLAICSCDDRSINESSLFPNEVHSERMATMGRTDAARRAGAGLARTATSIAIAAATMYASVSTLLSEMPMGLRRMKAAVRMSPTATPGAVSLTTPNRIIRSTRRREAQRDAHSYLASARCDHQADDAVYSERGQHKNHAARHSRDAD